MAKKKEIDRSKLDDLARGIELNKNYEGANDILNLRKASVVNTSSITNQDGNIIKKTENLHTMLPSEPSYVKLYTSDISKLFGLTSANSDVLHYILKEIKWDNTIKIGKKEKDEICKATGLKIDAINASIQKMKKEEILLPTRDDNGNIYRGVYMANPFIFGKGKWDESISYLRVLITYNQNGRDIKCDKYYRTPYGEEVNIEKDWVNNPERQQQQDDNFDVIFQNQNHTLDGVNEDNLHNLFQNTSKEEFLCAMNMIADKLYNDKPRPKGLQLLD